MNILVTGGTGFIGNALSTALIEEGHTVYITGREDRVPYGAKLLNLHLTGLDFTALSKKNIEAVFHEAANNDTQSTDEDDMVRANFDAPAYLFNMLERFGCRKFIYASTTAVYGNEPAPYIEDVTPRNPLTFYGKTKRSFEDFATNFGKQRPKISVIGLRYCNVYGHGEQHKGKRASMIYQMLDRFYTSHTWEPLVGPNYCCPKIFEFGEQSRDWIYIDDVVKANLLALKHPGSGIYNVGTGVATSFNRLVEIMNEIKGTKWAVEYIKNPIAGTYQDYTCCNIDKIKKDMGFSVDYPIELGITRMMEFFDFMNQTHPST